MIQISPLNTGRLCRCFVLLLQCFHKSVKWDNREDKVCKCASSQKSILFWLKTDNQVHILHAHGPDLINKYIAVVLLLCQGPSPAEQASGFAARDSGLAAVSQRAVQSGHIAPALRARTVQPWRVEQGRKSPAWSQQGGNMDHTEHAGVKSHKYTKLICVCVRERERERERVRDRKRERERARVRKKRRAS